MSTQQGLECRRGEYQAFPWFGSIWMFRDPSKSLQAWIVTNNALLAQGKLFLGQWRRCLISPPAQNTDEGSLFQAAWWRGMLLPGELKLVDITPSGPPLLKWYVVQLCDHTHADLLPSRLINSLWAVSHPQMPRCRESCVAAALFILTKINPIRPDVWMISYAVNTSMLLTLYNWELRHM